MTKKKSRTWAKSKFLLMIPVICFLVLAFAHPRAVSPAVNAKSIAELETSAADDVNKQTQSKDQERKEKEKKLKEIMHEEQILIEKLEATDNPEERKQIKLKLEKLQKMKVSEGLVEEKPFTMTEQQYKDTVIKLKTMIEKSDNPEETAKLKKKLADLTEMKEKGRDKSEAVIDYEKKTAELKKLWEKTEDPQKKKMIEEKLKQLKQMMQKEREKKKIK